MDKEIQKLADLEFEWKVAVITKQDEDIIKIAKAKFIRQYNKVFKVPKIDSNEQKEENSVNVQEEEKTFEKGNK